MKESRMQRNCERCRLRKSQETYLGIVFDYRTCPFVCVENKLYDNLKRKKERTAFGLLRKEKQNE